MEFTYTAYEGLLNSLGTHGYAFADYHNWENYPRCVILRHDIDNDIEKALALAKIEKGNGVKSTFFALVTSDFYNVYSARSEKLLLQIMECGHEIGLHFDEVRYPDISSPKDIIERIIQEAEFLCQIIGTPITTVSMHRPSKMILESDIQIPGIVNSYSSLFFKDIKYLSDSRKRWREPVDEIVKSEKYQRLHILTHPIWYDDMEKSIHDSISSFINAGNRFRYFSEMDNITDLGTIMSEHEIL